MANVTTVELSRAQITTLGELLEIYRDNHASLRGDLFTVDARTFGMVVTAFQTATSDLGNETPVRHDANIALAPTGMCLVGRDGDKFTLRMGPAAFNAMVEVATDVATKDDATQAIRDLVSVVQQRSIVGSLARASGDKRPKL